MEDKHWAQDDELIERFILNSLNPEDRNELEDHLRICEVCKQEVRAQQLLVAGIRRGGREAFKALLREKVGLLPEKRIPWPHILSAAAVIVILLSVGIYNRWFETVKQPGNTVVLIHPDAAPADLSKDSVEESTQPPADARLDDKSAPIADRSLQASKRKKETKAPTGSGVSVMDEDKRKAIESGRDAQGAGAISNQAESAQEFQADIGVDEPTMVWLEGTVLPSEEELRQRRKTEERGIPQATHSYGKADALRTTPSSPQKRSTTNSSVLVIQRTVASLLPAQQQLQQPKKVMTKVERVGEQIQFTVYLDSLLDESDLAQTTIEPAGNDSIIVNLPSQKVRYKLPVEWNQLLLSKPAK